MDTFYKQREALLIDLAASLEREDALKQQRDELLAAHKANADLAFDTLGQPPRTWYRGLKLLMDSSLAAITKVKGD